MEGLLSNENIAISALAAVVIFLMAAMIWQQKAHLDSWKLHREDMVRAWGTVEKVSDRVQDVLKSLAVIQDRGRS